MCDVGSICNFQPGVKQDLDTPFRHPVLGDQQPVKINGPLPDTHHLKEPDPPLWFEATRYAAGPLVPFRRPPNCGEEARVRQGTTGEALMSKAVRRKLSQRSSIRIAADPPPGTRRHRRKYRLTAITSATTPTTAVAAELLA